ATAGMTGATVMLTLTLSTLGLPLEGVGLLLAIDPILDMGRTALNVTGQSLVAVIVAKREQILDHDAYRAARRTSREALHAGQAEQAAPAGSAPAGHPAPSGGAGTAEPPPTGEEGRERQAATAAARQPATAGAGRGRGRSVTPSTRPG